MAALRGIEQPIRILCARELQNSIRDSVHSEIVAAIESYPWLADRYEWGESYIRGKNGTEFLFRGLRTNYREIKSLSKVAIAWIEEAESVSDSSWDVLIPTIREPQSEVWFTFNPEAEDSPVRQRFIVNPPPDTKTTFINYSDNPWFPSVLESERQHMYATDPDRYAHIWEGECITRTDAQILGGKWVVEDFTPGDDWDGPYFGADWGFAADPTTAVKCWIHGNRLYVERESVAVRLELDDTADRWQRDIPGIERYTVRSDSARPESISHVKRNGMPRLMAVEKWPGSVEDGIAHLRSYEKIVIHPQCPVTTREARLYSYKVDSRTGDILPAIAPGNDHCIDAIRYALQVIIQQGLGRHTATASKTTRAARRVRY